LIGIDSNVLLRYIAQDDPVQSSKATAFIESLSSVHPGVISLVSIAELYWMLDHIRKTGRDQIITTFAALLNARELRIENAAVVRDALALFATTNVDFDDCLIARTLTAAGCDSIMTFDKRAAKSAGMTLLR
jgi:predicted nucleic-acid-binding protein